jgi:hypothetical protein
MPANSLTNSQDQSFPGSWQSISNGQQGGVAEMQRSGLSPQAAPTAGLPPSGGWGGMTNTPSAQGPGPGPLINGPFGGGNYQYMNQQPGQSQSYIGGSGGGYPINPYSYDGYNYGSNPHDGGFSFLNPMGNFRNGMFGNSSPIGPFGILGGLFGGSSINPRVSTLSSGYSGPHNMSPTQTPVGFSQPSQMQPMGINQSSSLANGYNRPYSYLGAPQGA